MRPRWNRVNGIIAPWAAPLSQNAAKYAIIDLGQAANAWGRLSPSGEVRRAFRSPRWVPEFKRRRHQQGFHADNGPETVRANGKVVILPKIGHVAMVEQLRFRGSIREVYRQPDCWQVVRGVLHRRRTAAAAGEDGPTIGVDVGVGAVAVCLDGTTVTNPQALASGIKRLRRLDKAIARSLNVHGKSNHSNRRERLYARRRSLYARVVNVRNDNHHKATTAIAKSAGPRGGGDAERVRHGAQPATGEGHRGRWHGWIPVETGVQVHLVRR